MNIARPGGNEGKEDLNMEKWYKFMVPLFLILLATQGVLIAVSTLVF